jgi:hypothetical protein
MSQQVLEGRWEEILDRADEFSGKRVRLTVLEEQTQTRPNEAMLAALREVAAIQKGMRLTPGEDSDELLREARYGGMYCLNSAE